MEDIEKTTRFENCLCTLLVVATVVFIGWLAHKRYVEHKWYEEHDAEIRANRAAYYRYMAEHTRNFPQTPKPNGRSNLNKLITSPAYSWHPANIHHRH